jgi:hypothetical protein
VVCHWWIQFYTLARFYIFSGLTLVVAFYNLFEKLIFWDRSSVFFAQLIFFLSFHIAFEKTFSFYRFLLSLFFFLLGFFISFLIFLFGYFKIRIKLVFIVISNILQIRFRFFFCFILLFVSYEPLLPRSPHDLILVFYNILSSLDI